MDIKNFLHQKEERKKNLFGQLLICIIIIIFIIFIIIITKSNKQEIINHDINEDISFLWELFADDNYPINTHIVKNNAESFWLKSNTINLNNFIGDTVEIQWYTANISSKYPILAIRELKIPSQKLIVSNNKFFFTDDMISFDFSKDIDIFAKKDKWQIVIYYQDTPMFYVDTFICSKVTPTQDCEQLKLNYTKNLNEMFTTYLGYNFYKNKENSWVTFNDDNIWYIFTTNDDEFLLNISHLINIIDSKFLQENKEDFILDTCSSDDIQMKEIYKLSKTIIDENLIKMTISWISKNNENIYCKINVNMFDNWNIENKSLSIDE